MATTMEKINEAIKTAMKAKDQMRLDTLRMMKSKILNVNARGEVDEKEMIQILSKYAKTVKEIIVVAEQNKMPDAVAQAKLELAVVKEFLPEELSEDQIKASIQGIIAALGPVTIKDMGRIMKETMTKIQGVDGNVVKKIVGEFLK
jgi:uncharacterized protein YqeY